VLDEPVWYEPLWSPDWLLPSTEPDAPHVDFVPTETEGLRRPDDRELREGLPMFLAEAVRFSTIARASAVFDGTADAEIRAEVGVPGGTGDRIVVVRVFGPGGRDLGTVTEPAPDDTALGRAIASLPGGVTATLRSAGVRSVWSTVYQPPLETHAADYVRGQAVCRFLRDPEAHRDVATDSEETARRRASVDAALRRLADLAGRVNTPFASMLFFAGLAASHQAGNPAYLGYRLSANGLCTTATDPRDPVFRASVLVFRMLGDPLIAAQRTRALATADDPELQQWLTRVEGVGSLV
jgi:hypothetical protein